MLPLHLRRSVLGACLGAAAHCIVATAPAQLLVDFNSTNQGGGPHNQSGYQAYNAGHEVVADFVAARSYSAFGTTVSLTVDFPDSTANSVQQMIDRGANWVGQKLDRLTDWLEVDTRPVTGAPRVTLALGALPAGDYHWVSYHHDTEHVFGSFDVEVSTDGGTSYSPVVGPEAGGSFLGSSTTFVWPDGMPSPDPDPSNEGTLLFRVEDRGVAP